MLRWGAALLVVAVCATSARAQSSDEIGIERFRPAIDREGMLDVEWPGVPTHLAWSAGAFVSFSHAPLVVYDRNMDAVDALVDRRVTTSLVGSIALFDRLELGASLDVVGYQSGTDVLATMEDLPSAGIGDARVLAKLLVLASDRYQLALVPAVTIPAGEPRGYLRESGATFSPAIAASMRIDRVRIATNLGYSVKPRVDSAGLISDDEAFARIALGVTVGDRQAPLAELWLNGSFATPIADAERNQVATELLVGAMRRISPMLDGFVAGGIGLDNGFGTPDWRALAGVRFGVERPAPLPPPQAWIAPVAPPARPRVDDPIASGKVTLVGNVVDVDGRPLPGATLTIAYTDQPTAPPIELTASAEGTFTVEVDRGPLEITTHVAGYKDAGIQVLAGPDQRTPVTVTLLRAVRQGQLRGQVLSFNGKPLVATITIKGNTEASATTDAQGQFALDLPEGAFSVEIQSPGHVTQKRKVLIKLDGVTVLNVDLRSGK